MRVIVELASKLCEISVEKAGFFCWSLLALLESRKINYVICQSCFVGMNLVLVILHIPISAQKLVLKEVYLAVKLN